jgi:EpsI family protein
MIVHNKKRATLFIKITLVIIMALSWNLYFTNYSQKDSLNIAEFPKTIGTWVSEDLPIPEEDLSLLETNNAFVRRYTDRTSGAEVYLYLVYSQHNRKVAHPPELCYTGSGISIIQNVHDPIPVEYKNLTIPTNRLKLLRKNFEHISFYWFKVGDRFTANYWEQQILIAFNALTGSRAGSSLVRISADVNDNQEKAIRNVKSFVNLITPALFQYLP